MRLYKYFDREKFELVFVNEGIKTRVSQASALNDPFESKLNIYQEVKKLSENTYFEKKTGILENDKKLKKLLNEEMEIQLKNTEALFKKILDEKYGIVSLTKRPFNKLMWSHYGDSHKGFCIEFDLDEKIEFREKLFKVKYRKNRIIYNSAITKDSYNEKINFFINLITTKDSIWKYEQEYRLVLDLKGIHPQDSDLSTPIFTTIFRPKYIKSVIFGHLCDQKNIDFVKAWISKSRASHINLLQIALCPEEYELILENIT